MIKTFSIQTTEKRELIDITEQVDDIIAESNIEDGICVLYTPHATGALIVNENENGLKKDIMRYLETLVPKNDYKHNKIDNNAEAHILSSILGTERTFVIQNGEVIRGTWQNIFFVELDGPRPSREIVVKILKA